MPVLVLVLINQYSDSYSCNNQVLRLVLVLTHIASTRICTRTRKSGTRPSPDHGTCVTHVPWCMLGSLTFPAFPAHAQPENLRVCKRSIGCNPAIGTPACSRLVAVLTITTLQGIALDLPRHQSNHDREEQEAEHGGCLVRDLTKLGWNVWTSGGYNRLFMMLYVFKHKMQRISIHAPYTRIVVFLHISNILQSFRRVNNDTPIVCKAAIFVKYCYPIGSCLS